MPAALGAPRRQSTSTGPRHAGVLLMRDQTLEGVSVRKTRTLNCHGFDDGAGISRFVKSDKLPFESALSRVAAACPGFFARDQMDWVDWQPLEPSEVVATSSPSVRDEPAALLELVGARPPQLVEGRWLHIHPDSLDDFEHLHGHLGDHEASVDTVQRSSHSRKRRSAQFSRVDERRTESTAMTAVARCGGWLVERESHRVSNIFDAVWYKFCSIGYEHARRTLFHGVPSFSQRNV